MIPLNHFYCSIRILLSADMFFSWTGEVQTQSPNYAYRVSWMAQVPVRINNRSNQALLCKCMEMLGAKCQTYLSLQDCLPRRLKGQETGWHFLSFVKQLFWRHGANCCWSMFVWIRVIGVLGKCNKGECCAAFAIIIMLARGPCCQGSSAATRKEGGINQHLKRKESENWMIGGHTVAAGHKYLRLCPIWATISNSNRTEFVFYISEFLGPLSKI